MSGIVAEVMTYLHDSAYGQLGEHDDRHDVRTDFIRNGTCLQLGVKNWKQEWHGVPELTETSNNVPEIFHRAT